jgi:hypothetical protein
VTIKLTGDGWALRPNPIDAVLLFDRSGSMGDAMPHPDPNTEMQDAQIGGKLFVTLVNASDDRTAVVSFSGDSSNYNVDTTVNAALTNYAVTLDNAINGMTPTSATGTRDGLYQAIMLLKNNPNPNSQAVRAIILLTDGDYNWLGDPLGRGTGYYPAPPTGYYGYSTGNLEPSKYLYYNGLGGTLNPPLEANFIGNTTATALQVIFTDKSLGTPTSYSWSLQDGNSGDTQSSTSKNPTINFPSHTSTRKYNVSETITDATGDTNTISQTYYITTASSTTTVNIPSSAPSPSYTAPDEQFTDQNMTKFAADNNIRLYMIAYTANGNLNAEAVSDMQVMANGTGGYFENAPSGATLSQIFTQIAGTLQTAAGVNTNMSLNFQNVNLTGVTVPGAQVFSYVPQTQITWQDGVTNYTDQSSQWNNNQMLNFNIGTINLGQTWQATFELMVKEGGSIQLFGNGSTITFNNGTSSLVLPPAYITAINNLTNNGATEQSIQLSNFVVTKSGVITDFVPLQWDTNYPGNATALERLYYSTIYQPASTCGAGTWTQPPFDSQSGIPPGASNETSILDVRTLPPGTYYFCVLATAADTNSAMAEAPGNTQVKISGKAYIKLQ